MPVSETLAHVLDTLTRVPAAGGFGQSLRFAWGDFQSARMTVAGGGRVMRKWRRSSASCRPTRPLRTCAPARALPGRANNTRTRAHRRAHLVRGEGRDMPI